ncbi:MAG: HD domain-containing protein [Acidobacteria bacterium]|nr:HD domain-containing protein [Thermoanaerobaculia bacterium]NLN11026.1 HD domain-containing protein [Acidobacteriota bacterium]MBP7813601.1 HD domain-containing protein [Thermoanaerobaculia bacterium]HPA96001.1 HD domain-containing protein [Thermoanaerobaculia bacterium]HRR13494.1 HD domain-containing protein [Thermoanaerobaculia bacterium]
MSLVRSLFRRLRLRHLLFLLLLASGTVPIAIAGFVLVDSNRELLKTQEKSFLTRSAASLSRELNESLVTLRRQLLQLGHGLLSFPGPESIGERLRERWVGDYLESFLRANSSLVELQLLDREGAGPRFGPADLAGAHEMLLDALFAEAVGTGRPAYRFTALPRGGEPAVALSVPIRDSDGDLELIVQAVARLRLIDVVVEREAEEEVGTFLVDHRGALLWSAGASPEIREQIVGSDLVRDFVRKPLNLTAEYAVEVGGRRQQMVGQVSPVEETGWGIVVHKPASATFRAARQMALTAVVAFGVLVFIALLVAAIAARWVGRPIQRLTETTHEIANGSFGRRLPEERMTLELAELAADFNRMSGHVEEYVGRLQEAATANERLFISSIRAFAAAIDAKDPYTRGHSERVATLSRAIARHLGQSEEFQQRLWIGALLHDVGKIGIEDRVLKKGGVLTAEEYEEMKRHPTVGADILAPIEPLRDMLPAVRWHHENWNGRGYPDGLRGEEVPLMARIVAVADCFDAITTNRPYQKAYEPPYAVATITKLAGTRFDAKVVTAFLRAYEAGEIAGAHEREEPVPLPAAATH